MNPRPVNENFMKLTNKVTNLVALFESKSKNSNTFDKSASLNKFISPKTSVKEVCNNYATRDNFMPVSSKYSSEKNDHQQMSYSPLFSSKLRPSKTISSITNAYIPEFSESIEKFEDSAKILTQSTYLTSLAATSSSSSCETTPNITPRSRDQEENQMSQNKTGPMKINSSVYDRFTNEPRDQTKLRQPVRSYTKNSQRFSLNIENNFQKRQETQNQTYISPIPVKK